MNIWGNEKSLDMSPVSLPRLVLVAAVRLEGVTAGVAAVNVHRVVK